jgi:hypothetical protein
VRSDVVDIEEDSAHSVGGDPGSAVAMIFSMLSLGMAQSARQQVLAPVAPVAAPVTEAAAPAVVPAHPMVHSQPKSIAMIPRKKVARPAKPGYARRK